MKSCNMDFFAAELDQKHFLDFIFSETDLRVFEAYSEFDQEIREFKSTVEVANAFSLGTDRHGNGSGAFLNLLSPSVKKGVTIEKINLVPGSCGAHTFRYYISEPAAIQLLFGGVYKKIITKTHFGHQSQVRAKNWGQDQGSRWDALRAISSKIEYHVRKRMASAKVSSRAILPHAYELAQSGYLLKEFAGSPWSYEFSSIQVTTRKRDG